MHVLYTYVARHIVAGTQAGRQAGARRTTDGTLTVDEQLVKVPSSPAAAATYCVLAAARHRRRFQRSFHHAHRELAPRRHPRQARQRDAAGYYLLQVIRVISAFSHSHANARVLEYTQIPVKSILIIANATENE